MTEDELVKELMKYEFFLYFEEEDKEEPDRDDDDEDGFVIYPWEQAEDGTWLWEEDEEGNWRRTGFNMRKFVESVEHSVSAYEQKLRKKHHMAEGHWYEDMTCEQKMKLLK